MKAANHSGRLRMASPTRAPLATPYPRRQRTGKPAALGEHFAVGPDAILVGDQRLVGLGGLGRGEEGVQVPFGPRIEAGGAAIDLGLDHLERRAGRRQPFEHLPVHFGQRFAHDVRPRQRRHHFSASGLIGEPKAPVIASGGADSMKL